MAMQAFKTGCDIAEAVAGAVASSAGALQGVGKVIDGSTNYYLKFREKNCYYCGERVKRKDIQPHVDKHKLIQCAGCNMKIKVDEYSEHLNAHYRTYLVKCFICSNKYRPEDLESHVQDHCLIQCPGCNMKIKVDEYSEHIHAHYRTYLVTCFICRKELKLEDLELHVQDHWLIQCAGCNMKIKVDEYSEHLEAHYRLIPCSECNKNINFEDYSDHVETHRLEICGYCYQKIPLKLMFEHINRQGRRDENQTRTEQRAPLHEKFTSCHQQQ